jgi:hypothetical protein
MQDRAEPVAQVDLGGRTLEDRSAMRAQLRIFRQLVEVLLRVG